MNNVLNAERVGYYRIVLAIGATQPFQLANCVQITEEEYTAERKANLEMRLAVLHQQREQNRELDKEVEECLESMDEEELRAELLKEATSGNVAEVKQMKAGGQIMQAKLNGIN
eukprot:COSAG01_NODE_4929_length_4614_cov_15.381395_5_plen_114_part_00